MISLISPDPNEPLGLEEKTFGNAVGFELHRLTSERAVEEGGHSVALWTMASAADSLALEAMTTVSSGNGWLILQDEDSGLTLGQEVANLLGSMRMCCGPLLPCLTRKEGLTALLDAELSLGFSTSVRGGDLELRTRLNV